MEAVVVLSVIGVTAIILGGWVVFARLKEAETRLDELEVALTKYVIEVAEAKADRKGKMGTMWD